MRASLYVVTSNLRCCPGTSWRSRRRPSPRRATCSGASPPPRQQNQRSSAASNSGCGRSTGRGGRSRGVPAARPPPAGAGCRGPVVAMGPPQAPATSRTARAVRGRARVLVRTSSSFSTSAGDERRLHLQRLGWRRTGRRCVRRSSGCGRRGRTSARTRPGPVRGKRRALDEQREAPRPEAEQASLAGRQEHRLQDLPGSGHGRAVAFGEQRVQRAVLQVGGEQAREFARPAGGPSPGAAARRRPAGAARRTGSGSRQQLQRGGDGLVRGLGRARRRRGSPRPGRGAGSPR